MFYCKSKILTIIGAGPAGYFAAINAAILRPNLKVIIFEKSLKTLSKVKISGGGRCNVTHNCFDPIKLTSYYPRGNRELKGPFHKFGPKETVQWFESREVNLKTEADGRMFPITDSSETIIDCLNYQAQKYQIEVKKGLGVKNISNIFENRFELTLSDESNHQTDFLLIASGSSVKIWEILQNLGHSVVTPVPSLFTFNTPLSIFNELSGVSCSDVEISIPEIKMKQRGPMLFTHWGISGPAALKLSAWAARKLADLAYKHLLQINFAPDNSAAEVSALVDHSQQQFGNKQVGSEPLFNLPKQLFKSILLASQIADDIKWCHISKAQKQRLSQNIHALQLQVDGKTTYKQEFVTSGGVELKEVNFKTLESKLHQNLFFAGEALNIDGVTGGFNFQNCWTTGYIAAQTIADKTPI